MASNTQAIHYVAAPNFFFTNVASVANPATDIFAISGSATRTIVVTGFKCVMQAPADTASSESIFVVRRTGFGTGGATTTVVTTGLDLSTSAATAVVKAWTTSPSPLGTLIGTIDMEQVAGFSVSTVDPHATVGRLSTPTIPGLSGLPFGGVVLSGATDILTLNLGTVGRTVAAGGLQFWCSVAWTEVAVA